MRKELIIVLFLLCEKHKEVKFRDTRRVEALKHTTLSLDLGCFTKAPTRLNLHMCTQGYLRSSTFPDGIPIEDQSDDDDGYWM